MKTVRGDMASRPSLASLLKAIAGSSVLWKSGLAVLRDWKIHAEFLSPAYQQHNIARLQHLESLGLDLASKNVLEIGAAIGDHSLFYLYRNCRVVAIEGRARLAHKLSNRLGIPAEVLDVDREPEEIERFGHFDFAHCYGLLYHLSNPGRFLKAVSHAADCLLLETCVSYGNEVRLNPCREPSSIPSQALHGEGCRPTREWIFRELQQYFPHVYATRTQPRHPEFPIDWTAPVPNGSTLKRAVFVASHRPVCNPNLIRELPDKQARW